MIKIKVQLFGGRGVGSTRIRIVRGFSTKLHMGGQGKHIRGHNNFEPERGRSELTVSMSDAQKLVNQYAGTGVKKGLNKELVNFGRIIGVWIDGRTGEHKYTTWGLIHYGKKGTHIIPANPNQY